MKFEAFADKYHAYDWRVEATNEQSDGEVYAAIFSGPDAQQRAEEYAAWKNQQSRSGPRTTDHGAEPMR